MGLTDKLPGWVSWAVRLLIYGPILYLIYLAIVAFSAIRLQPSVDFCISSRYKTDGAKETALLRTKRWVECIDKRIGPFERLAFSGTGETIMALPSTPCQFVGVWKATRRPQGWVYEHTLNADGQFSSTPIASISHERVTGSWGVHGTQFIWLYDEGTVWPPDINPIINDKPYSFTLKEIDGSETDFELIQRMNASFCTSASGLN